jgi:hypothetical protein
MAIFDPMPASVSSVFPAAAEYNYAQGLKNYDTAGGYLSNARHATASALQRDALGGGIMGGIGANVLGGLNEVAGLIKGGVRMLPEKYGGSKKDDFGDTWRQTKEDLAANLYGSLYGKNTGAQDVYSNMINQLSISSGTGIKGWLENIMEKEAEEGTPFNTLTLDKLKFHQMKLRNQKKQQMQQRIRQGEKAAQQAAAREADTAARARAANAAVYASADRQGFTNAQGGFSTSAADRAGTSVGSGQFSPSSSRGRSGYFDGGLASLWLR